MSTMRQQLHPNSAKNLFRKQKSIDLNDKPASDSKKMLRKQLSVDHVTSGLKHVQPPPVPINFSNLLWRNSTQSLNESNLKVVSSSAVKKRAQFATNSINTSALSNRQELLNECLNRNMKSVGEGTNKTRVNISIFLSQDLQDDGLSDNEVSANVEHQALNNKPSVNSSTNASVKSTNNSEASSATSSRISVSARRAQFQATRRIMSAPIRPMNIEDSKNKRKPTRKKKVIRVNLTLNRDKDDIDDPPDEMPDEVEVRKPIAQQPTVRSTKAKPLATRSRSVLGCDQVGIETLVSMLSSGGSDSEKEEPQSVQVAASKPDTTRSRTSMLRKTVSFQDDESLLQLQNKDPFSRRNSNVPFAGRMRNTRSLFGNEISNLYLPNREDAKSPEVKNENDLNSSNKTKGDGERVEKTRSEKHSEGVSDDKKSQDSQTPKEQECWRLYEKMKKTGLNVSYDTILRGILKPSELRLLEKQKKFLGDIAEKSTEGNETQPEPQKVN